jgi:hypothetical protein
MRSRNASAKNRHPHSSEKMRSALLQSRGIMHSFSVSEELRQSRFFIDTMERFISDSEKEEVDALKEQTESMTDDEKDDFWQNNFPVHWDEVFGIRIRSAFCTQLCSQVEGTLSSISGYVQVLSRSPLSFKNIKGPTVLEQHRLYLESFGSFSGPSNTLWKEMGHMFRVRNVQDDRDFVAFLDRLPNVGTRSDFIELQAGSCPAFLDIAERFQEVLFAEYQALRERLVALEAS